MSCPFGVYGRNKSQLQNLFWNVCGLNSKAKQEDVKQIINMLKHDIICLQETKIGIMTPSIIINAFGLQYEANYVSLPADGTRGDCPGW
jgi:hypothetical protein